MENKKELKRAREAAKQEVKMWLSNDWDLDGETPSYFLLKKNTQSGLGHLLVFFLTVWFTFGVGNLIYWFACRKKKKIMK